MGRHSKPRNHTAAAVFGTACVTVPLMQGTAIAHPTINWGPIIQCESGGNPRAHNPSGASGLFQFLGSTWRSLGGLAFGRSAAEATPEEQLEIANRAYARQGLTPWEASRPCWNGRRVQAHAPVFRHRIAFRGPEAVETTSYGTYRVEAGDTLSRIAAEHGGTWEDLFAENRGTIQDPNRIYTGTVLQLGYKSRGLTEVRPRTQTPKRLGGYHHRIQPSALTAGARQTIQVQTTGYSYGDNQGGSNAKISAPVLHRTAGGDGTYANPVTLAVPGHGGSGMQTPAGTRVYFSKYRFYGIVEDSGATAKRDRRFDIWTDGRNNPAASRCMDELTGTSAAILNPPPGEPVSYVGPRSDANGCHAGGSVEAQS